MAEELPNPEREAREERIKAREARKDPGRPLTPEEERKRAEDTFNIQDDEADRQREEAAKPKEAAKTPTPPPTATSSSPPRRPAQHDGD